MAIQYPTTFPCPLLDGFGITVAMGVIRSDNKMHQAQRRVFNTMPHVFTMSFAMTLPVWAAWQQWVNNNGYQWFQMSLPNMYAGQAGKLTTPTLIRFVSPITSSNLTESHVRLSVTAEMAPSMIRNYLEAV